MSADTTRRHRRHAASFLSPGVSPFVLPVPSAIPTDRLSVSSTVHRPLVLFTSVAVKPKTKRTGSATKSRTHSSRSSVVTPLPQRKPRSPRRSRFSQPVPEAKPHEILPTRRGRDSRRQIREAEHFRRYIYLRRQLKPWSDAFRAQHGRTPSLIDVHASDVPGLLDRFVEYLEALEGVRFDIQKAEN